MADKEWTLSAKQLVLACKCALKAETCDRELSARLEDAYRSLVPQLTAGLNEDSCLAEDARKLLNQIAALQMPLYTLEERVGAQAARITEYLSSETPFALLDPSALFSVPGLESSPRPFESAKGDDEHTSTLSTAESRKIGLTMSDNQVFGMSDSDLWP